MNNIYDPIGKLLGNWSMEVNLWSILLRLTISIVVSAVVGWERSNKRHAAGLRTFMIVSLASTIAMILDLYLIKTTNSGFWFISAATVVGTAVISANTILYSSKNQIKGLTTSAALWATGIMGLLIGTGNYTIVLFCSVAFISLLSLVPPLEIYLKDRSNHFEFHLELKNVSYLKDFSSVIRELGLRIDGIESNPAYLNSGLSVYSVSVSIIKDELKQFKSHQDIIDALKTLDYVYYIEEMK
ncbi:MAG TPA: MgtC/SapB family protein [Bacilli bacterium]|jgi:putative Mg2+ transporter-C (MgtC) family protein|nr:MAG: putative Mg(2+) transport ATPase [Tenericutes bacterium ADurb.Bin140]HOE77835.1 MgtC/SapB family protein [Bacilli bacterium]HOR95725.1 MgtC/SapB family protein [Bacilli bacterium]HPD12235.1 MgtC/SapB family protein [Bacilli bacterium]HPK58397.1 MgtC/SapB family protein [Bacilli bacterium]